MGEVYSHLSEEERQVIQIEIGNGTGVRAMARMSAGRSHGTRGSRPTRASRTGRTVPPG